jgi:hypothetical protein
LFLTLCAKATSSSNFRKGPGSSVYSKSRWEPNFNQRRLRSIFLSGSGRIQVFGFRRQQGQSLLEVHDLESKFSIRFIACLWGGEQHESADNQWGWQLNDCVWWSGRKQLLLQTSGTVYAPEYIVKVDGNLISISDGFKAYFYCCEPHQFKCVPFGGNNVKVCLRYMNWRVRFSIRFIACFSGHRRHKQRADATNLWDWRFGNCLWQSRPILPLPWRVN